MSEQNPYQTPATDIENGTSATETVLASRWIRLGAAVIDSIILLLIFIPMLISMGVYDGFPESMEEPDLKTSFIIAFGGVLLYGLVNGYTLFRNGQTVGKLICKIKIVRVDYSRATLTRIIFVRYLPMTFVAQIPVVGVFIGGLLDSLLIFRKSHQCLHDTIADTIVIRA